MSFFVIQVTDSMRNYIESKLNKAIHNFAHTVREIDVTVSVRGGEAGTKGKKYVHSVLRTRDRMVVRGCSS